jgi:hypothetical protein
VGTLKYQFLHFITIKIVLVLFHYKNNFKLNLKILEKLLFKLKTLNRVGENVSLIINQEKMARLDKLFHSYEP